MAMAHRGSVRLFGKMIQVTGEGEEKEDNLHACEDDGGGGGSASTAATSFGEQLQAQPNHEPTTESMIHAAEHGQSNENQSKLDIIPCKEGVSTVKSSVQKDEEEGQEEEENDTCESDSLEKTLLKKPDRILPCPRCNSQDTKFCYFNNYNVNQPRHFCRNCQRYWTAGGAMRNMAVGAGRRKNKSASSSCRYQSITSSELESLQTIQSSFPELVTQTSGTVLSFESDRPSCESLAPVQNVADKNSVNYCCRNGDGDEHSSGSVVTGLNSDERGGGGGTRFQQPSVQNCQPPMQYISVPPWAYTYYHVVPYWGYALPNPENNHRFSPHSTGAPRTSGLSSQLGKHPRDENTSSKQSNNAGELDDTTKQSGAQGRRCLSFPQKLAIEDDPDEAAKSSVWLAMDLKKHKADCINGGGLFKAIRPKALVKSQCLVRNHSEVHHPNPAAWLRSVRFREGL